MGWCLRGLTLNTAHLGEVKVIAEHGAPTEREVQVLLIAQAMGGAGFTIDGCFNENEVRVAARRLAARKYAELHMGQAGETLRLTCAGAAFIRGRAS